LQATRNRTSAVRCETDISVTVGPYDKTEVLPPASADLHVVRRTNRIDQTRSVPARKREKEEKNIFTKKMYQRMLLLCRIVVWDRRATSESCCVVIIASLLQLIYATKHKSGHLQQPTLMSFHAQSA
jgi:hypothetical protein